MDNQYYILEDGEQTGPFTLDELIEKEPDIHTRILSPNEDTWQDACDLPELFEYFIALGVNFPTEDNLASFWIRFGAYFVDMIILYVLLSFVMAFLILNKLIVDLRAYATPEAIAKMPYKDFLLLEMVLILTMLIYNTACEASGMKATIGKRVFKLVVVDADGMRLSFLNSLGRNIGKIVSVSLYFIGFISIFFTEHRQAMHDLLAKTYVVRTDQ